MSSFLGPHISILANQDSFFKKAKPRIAKLLVNGADPDRLRELARLSPSTVWIGRIVLDDQNLDNPAQSGRELGERIIETARSYPEIDYWEGYNEINPTTREEMAAFGEHEIQRTLTLRLAGLEGIIGGFSLGTPGFDVLPWFYPALKIARAWHSHEYSFPSMKDAQTWLCGRFVRYFEMMPKECRKPWCGSEVGIDAGSFRGWKSFTSPSGYLQDLAWYDQLLTYYAPRYPILGATVFGWWGRTTKWDDFDIDGEMARLLGDYIAASRRPKLLTLFLERVRALLKGGK